MQKVGWATKIEDSAVGGCWTLEVQLDLLEVQSLARGAQMSIWGLGATGETLSPQWPLGCLAVLCYPPHQVFILLNLKEVSVGGSSNIS